MWTDRRRARLILSHKISQASAIDYERTKLKEKVSTSKIIFIEKLIVIVLPNPFIHMTLKYLITTLFQIALIDSSKNESIVMMIKSV